MDRIGLTESIVMVTSTICQTSFSLHSRNHLAPKMARSNFHVNRSRVTGFIDRVLAANDLFALLLSNHWIPVLYPEHTLNVLAYHIMRANHSCLQQTIFCR